MDRKRTRVGAPLLTAIACTTGMVMGGLGGVAVAVPEARGTAALASADLTSPASVTAVRQLLKDNGVRGARVYRGSDGEIVVDGLSKDGKRCFGKKATKGVTKKKITDDPDFDGKEITGTPGDDVIIGTVRSDLILGGKGNDLICARGGDDDIGGGRGSDTIDAGWGDDLAVGDANLLEGSIDAKPGRDKILGGAGNDLLIGDHSTDDGSVRVNGKSDFLLDASNLGVNTPDLPFSGDQLVGDHFAGELGDVVGKGGNDTLIDLGATKAANARANSFDFLVGDHITTEGGNVSGDGGNDYLFDEGGNRDDLVGDHVSRTELVPPAPAPNGRNFGGSVLGAGGNDRIIKLTGFAQNLTGDSFGDRAVAGRGGNDYIQGPDGNPNLPGGDFNMPPNVGTFFVIGDHYSNGAADSFGGGNDVIRLGDGADGVGTDNNKRRAVVAGDSFARINLAGNESDVNPAPPAQVRQNYGGGNDDISTGGGDEYLIVGGEGNDKIDGGAGTDKCDGGQGTDTAANCETVLNVP